MRKLYKRISVIVIALVLLTVGGVYANWVFDDKGGAATTKHFAVLITQKTEGSTKGTYAIDVADGFMKIDQNSQTANPNNDLPTHQAVIVFNGKIRVKFTPNTNASEDVKTNGIETKFNFSLPVDSSTTTANPTFSIDSDGRYDNENGTATEIFNVISDVYTIFPMDYAGSAPEGQHLNKWIYDEAGGFFYFDLDNSNGLSSVIKINDFVIDTVDAYDVFADIISRCHITLNIHDAANIA